MGPSQDCREILISALSEANEDAKELGRGKGGRELSLTITKLEEALFWANQSYKIR